jgi:tetratricopeptide (TPR) repeat protein
VRTALLVEFYRDLPQPGDGNPDTFGPRLQAALERFRRKVAARYTEGSLQRLLAAPESTARRAAVVALGLMGGGACNEPLARRLHDADPLVRQLAVDALWAVWFRGDSAANNQELQRLTRLRDPAKALAGLDALVHKAPHFAEAYNQRAILHFRRGDFDRSIADCQKTLQLNPVHFGAQSGLAQCYMKLKRPKAALKAFRAALELNPNLEGVEQTIRSLEDALGEEGKK